ncbi:MAG: NADH-quinone oxidoreductase subunit NuoK [Myxococcota bacterium]
MPTGHFLVVAALLFAIGAAGVIVRRNVLMILMSIELMLSGGSLTLIAFARHHGDVGGHGLAFLVVAVAAAEAAIGLAIIVALFRTRRTANADDANLLRDE